MTVLGLDLGSRQVKLCILKDDVVIKRESWHTAAFYRTFCSPAEGGALKVDLRQLTDETIDICVSTGYGRNNTYLSDFYAINELKAHSLGAVYQTGERDFILLDVGGQDVKIMRVENGNLVDMNLNDKCAASCGRFLEQMAEVLDIPLDALMEAKDHPVALSSTCAVFCESELIGKLAEGHPTAHLAAGVNQSLFMRIRPMMTGFEHNKLWLSGGVARSLALQKALTEHYETVREIEDSTYNGALGCCVHGRQLLNK